MPSHRDADRVLAARYFAEHQEPDLRASGVPDAGVAHLASRYIRDATANPEAMQRLRELYSEDGSVTAPPPLAGLLDHLAAQLAAPADAGPECQAVWRDPTDRAIVACADDAEPGRDLCEWHQDRSHGRLMMWRYRSEAVRVQRPDRSDKRS